MTQQEAKELLTLLVKMEAEGDFDAQYITNLDGPDYRKCPSCGERPAKDFSHNHDCRMRLLIQKIYALS